MERNAKRLQEKAKTHRVFIGAGRGEYIVESGASGEKYRVWALSDDGYVCTCGWGQRRRTAIDPCSHILAVLNWQEVGIGRRFSFWKTSLDAARQHRPIEQVGRGLWSTSRKLAASVSLPEPEEEYVALWYNTPEACWWAQRRKKRVYALASNDDRAVSKARKFPAQRCSYLIERLRAKGYEQPVWVHNEARLRWQKRES